MTMIRVKLLLLIAAALLSCGLNVPDRTPEPLVQFGVFSVGQGLSQMVRSDTAAIVFDMGPPEGIGHWRTVFTAMGKTRISGIVISHNHRDHWGGLQMLDTDIGWDGLVVTNPYVDTAALRDAVPRFKSIMRFRVIAAGDTLALAGVDEIRCVWPPSHLDGIDSSGDFENRVSLVFIIKKGTTAALITSDIDSVASQNLCLRESTGLKADILVVPHHGSRGSLDPVFYGYVSPSFSIASYGSGNGYGHPSADVLLWLSQTGGRVLETAIDGDCFFESNGYYWRTLFFQ